MSLQLLNSFYQLLKRNAKYVMPHGITRPSRECLNVWHVLKVLNCNLKIKSLKERHNTTYMYITSGFRGGGRRGRAAPPLLKFQRGSSRRAKEGARPLRPPFWKSKEGLQTGPLLRPPPLSTNPGSAPVYHSFQFYYHCISWLSMHFDIGCWRKANISQNANGDSYRGNSMVTHITFYDLSYLLSCSNLITNPPWQKLFCIWVDAIHIHTP